MPTITSAVPSASQRTHLRQLEAESIHILREVVAEFENPAMLYSIGKDSSVLLHLARKAFYPGKPPFPFVHIDSTWEFHEMTEFRDQYVRDELGMRVVVEINEEGRAQGVNPFDHGSKIYTDVMRTQPLKAALTRHRFDAAIGGGRRDEERSRAKERVFSFRDQQHRWDPRNQRPELWRVFNTWKHPGESIRVFPLFQLDRTRHLAIHLGGANPFGAALLRQGSACGRAGRRPDCGGRCPDATVPGGATGAQDGPLPYARLLSRYRAVESSASSLEEIVEEMRTTRYSERQGRAIDRDESGAMEKKKREGYF